MLMGQFSHVFMQTSNDKQNEEEQEGGAAHYGEEATVPGTYHDGEFYQALLNEFLEGNAPDGTKAHVKVRP